MGWKSRKMGELWRFFTKFVGWGPVRLAFDLPEKPTKANLGPRFSRPFPIDRR